MKQNPKIVEVPLELDNVSTLEVFRMHVRKFSGMLENALGVLENALGVLENALTAC